MQDASLPLALLDLVQLVVLQPHLVHQLTFFFLIVTEPGRHYAALVEPIF
jgi:hypothetical protein